MAIATTSADFREGIDSFLQKRPPVFPPLAYGLDPAAVTGAELPELGIVPGEVLGHS